MRTTSIIAGGLGLTVIGVLLLVMGLAGGAILFAAAPPGAVDPIDVRTMVHDHREALAACATGLSQPGELNATITVYRGQLRSLQIADANIPQSNAACVAEVLQGLPWPQGNAAVRIPIRLDP